LERETIFNTKLTTVKKILNWLRTICIVYVILIVGVRCLDTVLKENIRYHIKHHQSQLLLDQIRQILTVGKTVYTNRRLLKPRYTLATSRLLPKPATNQRQSQLSPIRSTLSSMRSTLSLDLATNRKQLEFDSLLRSTLSPNRWTFLPIWSILLTVTRMSNVLSTLSPVCMGPTKSTVLNSTLLLVCTRLYTQFTDITISSQHHSPVRRRQMTNHVW